jgi:DNA-binding CsgD family transcriptional regulator
LGAAARGESVLSPSVAARLLFISEASVKAHLLHVYAKLGVNDRAAAVAAAYERGCSPRAAATRGVRGTAGVVPR